ncbi:hypothetical protein FHR83_009336 [Actinoplanes campanulatus]|uniref:Uncharacterized protein n=1 Tax=Actinoplanes campanulatus TaxID=113559 RepID=A0A7W5FKF6_9ACTN|nr:hypothetical protein [Actinoplanes campanulatus]
MAVATNPNRWKKRRELCPVRADIACFIESNPWMRLKSYRDGSTRATMGGW